MVQNLRKMKKINFYEFICVSKKMKKKKEMIFCDFW